MRDNSQPKTLVIKNWLSEASESLKNASIPSSTLDAELLAAFYLNVDRSYLHAHEHHELNTKQIQELNELLKRRLEHEPLAYITGSKEFYGRLFKVNSSVLIPRPESENIIDFVKLLTTELNMPKIVDVGTGSGCLSITLALEILESKITGVDISSKALEVAQENAKLNHAKVEFTKSNLLTNTTNRFNIIVANLPYVDKVWQVSPEVHYEPDIALFADDSGLHLIYELINQAPKKLEKNGYLILEADPRQHSDIIKHATKKRFRLIDSKDYILLFTRDQWPRLDQ